MGSIAMMIYLSIYRPCMNPKDVDLKTMTLGGNGLPPRVEDN
jgi:hypothetical protein